MRMARVARRLAAAGVVALGAVAAGHHPARAFSGDVFPGTPPGEVPTYTISAASCESIREDVGDTGNLSDLIVACSRAGGGGPPCDLVDGSADSVVPIGQCVDKFPIPLATVNPALGLLNGINLKGTSSGSNVRFSDRDRVSVTFADTLARVDVEVELGAPRASPQRNGDQRRRRQRVNLHPSRRAPRRRRRGQPGADPLPPAASRRRKGWPERLPAGRGLPGLPLVLPQL